MTMTNFTRQIEKLQPETIAVLGVPFDKNSSFRQGAALAPPRIREALFSESANLWTENGIDLGLGKGWRDVGDLIFPEKERAFEEIELAVETLLASQATVISLGGDHSISYPILQAYARSYTQLSILQFDAHPDTYDELNGNRFSHASPFARIMEEGLVERLVQVGIRTMTGHQKEQAERFGVEVLEMRHAQDWEKTLRLEGDIYLSLDIDCLDPAFAPGVSHYEPGGMSTREVLNIIQALPGNIVGADIVEYNPERDYLGMTGMVAAKFLKEILSKMLAKDLSS